MLPPQAYFRHSVVIGGIYSRHQPTRHFHFAIYTLSGTTSARSACAAILSSAWFFARHGVFRLSVLGLVKMHLRSITSLFCLCTLMLSSALEACDRPLRTLFYPLAGTGDVAAESIDTDALALIANAAGCSLIIERTSTTSKRRLRMLEDGEIDILAGLFNRPERRTYAWVSEPYREAYLRMYTRSPAPELAQLQAIDLLHSKHTVLMLSGAWPGTQMESIAKQLALEKRLLEFHTSGDGLKMFLDQQRGDILIGADIVYLTAREHWQKEIYALPIPLLTDTLHIMLSKKNLSEITLKKFNEAIEKTEVRQTIQQLVNAHYSGESTPTREVPSK